MTIFAKVFTILLLFSALPANATVIEISYPEQNIVRAMLSEIDAVDERVYSVRLNEDGTATIQFGDGIQGSRPSSGGNVVASYRYGGGIQGKIINEYEIVEQKFPFIPVEDFWPIGTNQPEASFVIAGLKSITFDFSPEGLKVIAAEPSPTLVPAPLVLLLFLTGLTVLVGFRKRIKTV
jgi:hypothetical protein